MTILRNRVDLAWSLMEETVSEESVETRRAVYKEEADDETGEIIQQHNTTTESNKARASTEQQLQLQNETTTINIPTPTAIKMQLSLIIATLFTAAISGVSAGPIPQPVPELDTETVALITRSLEARADQAQQANALAQAQALAQLQQCRGGGCGGWYGRGGWQGRYSRAGGDFDFNVLGLLDLSASGGRTNYCTWPAC